MDRDFNEELKDTSNHKYAYDFDFKVMHKFMIRSFIPFFLKRGSALELGSFKGEFTNVLLRFFDSITCVEASKECCDSYFWSFDDRVEQINGMFESVHLLNKYDNVFLIHTLEHVEDPVFVLKRINEEWLSNVGRLFLVCPNANAASRQIAVKMRLIDNNSAVTEAEAAHGHKRTYSLNTLESDARKAGLSVMYRSGIFFKALSNFQWDTLLGTDIISKEYLEGCYQLGQQYPDLCSSIFLVCEKGR